MTSDSNYMKRWRAEHPERYREQKRREYLRDRALRELGTKHPTELERIRRKLERRERSG